MRLKLPVDAPDAISWLQAQPFGSQFYWHGRGEEARWAGAGVADLCSGPDGLARLAERLDVLRREGSDARYFGGMRFAPAGPSGTRWRSFGCARFVLPRFELHEDREGCTIVLNIIPSADRLEDVLEDIHRLGEAPAGRPDSLPLPVGRIDAPDLAGWRQGMAGALHAFTRGALEKVVLARRATYTFDQPLDPLALARSLEAATPSCFHFVIQPEAGTAFVGATPERLFRREGRRAWTEAVAGTRPRGRDPVQDTTLRDELLASEKERREHDYVADQILAALAPFAAAREADPIAPLALTSKWHLRTAIRAGLKDGVHTMDLLEALHPTPAVAGTPTAAALARIAATEPFDRGWYAGPVGWAGADAAEFAVAIRSGLVRQTASGAALDLYSGAGIVRGSDPEAEWAEIEHKVVDFARVLGLEA